MRSTGQRGVYWTCPRCAGHALNLSLLRRVVRPSEVRRLWQTARAQTVRGPRSCPACRHRMFEVTLQTQPQAFTADVCRTCQFVWFDTHELEALPSQSELPPARLAALPQAARERIAIHEAEAIGERVRDTSFGTDPPDEWWQYLPALVGLPVEHEAYPVGRQPWGTLGLVAVTVVLSVAGFFNLRTAAAEFGLMPDDLWRLGGLTLLTSFFLHAGILHLAGNMYFLLGFGDNVEDYLGTGRFLGLLLLSTVAGGLSHVLANPDSTVACIGASGGISGVIVFYALQFPQARLGLLLRLGWVHMPAWFALVLWLVFQVCVSLLQVRGVTRVSGMAHLGGAAMGLLVWLWMRHKGRFTAKPPLRRDN